jgi:hypothetical protein
MSDLDFQEQAQLGLKYIEDSVVNLLTRHPKGLSSLEIANSLGLAEGLEPAHRHRLVEAIIEMLIASGRILRDGSAHLLKDNPERS